MFSNQHVGAPHLEISSRLEAVALQAVERDQSGLGGVLRSYRHGFAAQVVDGGDGVRGLGDDVG
jgi:hypothetical protein